MCYEAKNCWEGARGSISQSAHVCGAFTKCFHILHAVYTIALSLCVCLLLQTSCKLLKFHSYLYCQ